MASQIFNLNNNEYFTYAKTIKIDNFSSLGDSLLENMYLNTVSFKSVGENGLSFDKSTPIRIYINDTNISQDSIMFSLFINGVDDNHKFTFSWNRNYFNSNSSQIDQYYPNYDNAVNMNRLDNSFMLLRVNPKISGNVKVVIDEDSNLYLDAFKVNAELSKRKYRKVPISYKDYYGRNVASYASTFPALNYIFNVPETYHNLFTVVNEYKKQYVDTYRYGVANNNDKLYSENFAALAPLSIGKNLPDYFVIFKINGVIDLVESMSNIDIMKSMLKDAKVVKSFDLREGSKIGTYIRTIQENSKKTNGTVFVSYNPNQFNTYTGITLDKGIVSTIYESPYSLKYKNQVQSDNFYTLGFERNGLISDHIVNFEYMFNDDNADLFEINTYFGLYLKMNENSVPCCMIDGSIMQIDGETPTGIDFNVDTSVNKDLLYCLYDKECLRIDSSLYSLKELNKYDNKLGENIIKTKTTKILDINESSKYFITFKLNDILEPGNHLKIINNNSNSNSFTDVYEIVFSNYEKYKNDGISECIVNHAYSEDNVNAPDTIDYTFYRIAVYSEFKDANTDITVEKQICMIYNALNSLIKEYNAPFEIAYSKDKLSIMSNLPNLKFERISNLCGNISDLDTIIDASIVSYFNDFYVPNVTSLNINDNKIPVNSEVLYANNFETAGNRIGYVINFNSFSENYVYQLNLDLKQIDDYKNYKYFFIKDGKHTYKIDNLINSYYSCSDLDKYMFLCKYNLNTNNDINYYLPYTWNFGVSGIFNIKDYNFNVLDGYSDIAMKGEEKKQVSYENNNIENLDILLGNNSTKYNIIKEDIPSEAFTSYISETDSVPIYAQISVVDVSSERIPTIIVDGSTDSSSYVDISVYTYDRPVELSMNKYLKFKYDRNITKSYISLTSPYNCKWVADETDVITNRIKLTYNNNLLWYDASTRQKNTDSYFFPVNIDASNNTLNNSRFSSAIGFRCIPYISSANYRKYFKSMLNSYVKYSNGSDKNKVCNELYEGNMSLDNIIYSSYSFDNKYSKVYYRGNNTLEFISGGVKFNLKFNSSTIVNLEKYNNYNGIFLISQGKNEYSDNDIEMFIDEKNETVAVIWHQFVNSLYNVDNNMTNMYSYSSDVSTLYMKRLPICYDLNMVFQSDTNGISIPTYSLIDSSLDISAGIMTFNDNFMFLLNDPKTANKDSSCNVSWIYASNNSKYWEDASINIDVSVNDFNIKKLNKLGNSSKSNMTYIYSDVYNKINSYDVALSYDGLKNDLSSAVVYIKTADGVLKYYDNYWSDMFNVSVIDPIEETFIKTNRTKSSETLSESKFYVHPTYYNPEMTDILSFQYNDESVSNIFKKNFNLSNIRISNVSNIKQMWYNKVSENMNYCFNVNKTAFGLGIDVKSDYNILSSVWENEFYNKYSRDAVQDEYDKNNLAGITNFIINENSEKTETNLYDYLPKVPNYLISNTLDLADVKSNIKLNKEVFNSSSYDASILYVYNSECNDKIYSNCVESPNFKKIK